MQKRGQVTLFVILGLVLLLIAALYLYARDQYGITVPTNQYLAAQLRPIQDNIEECIQKEFEPGARLLAHQGGSFIPNTFIRYKNMQVRVVCADIPGKQTCLNLLQPFTVIEHELQAYLQFKIDHCINRELASKPGYTVEGTKNVLVKVKAQDDAVEVTVNYDIKLVKDAQSVILPEMSRVLRDAPLASLYPVVVDLVNSEARSGSFDTLGYMLQKRGHYLVTVDKPYPDKVYKISKKGSTYEYWVAVQGGA